jgi:DHA3 family tetracycline resistance protein-like MFS transporter
METGHPRRHRPVTLHPQDRDTLLPGRALDPRRVFLAQATLRGFATSMALTVYGLYVVRDLGMSALQLVLIGTALEGAMFLSEVPTGIVADAYSRRLSVIISFFVTALGWALMIVVPSFVMVFVSQVIWGIGATFGSGAREAWLTDEIGEDGAAPMFLRARQLWLAGHLTGIPISVLLGLVSLRLSIGAAALVHLVVVVVLLVGMSERGWRPAPRDGRRVWRRMGEMFGRGARVVRSSRVLVGIFVIAVFGGVASEALDRLWPLHMVDNFTFPPIGGLGQVGWFGVIQAGSVLGAIGVTALAGRFTKLGSAVSLARSLAAITVVLIVAVVVFASSHTFWVALVAFWVTDWVRTTEEPLRLAWINRGLDPRSRATVLSMFGQSDALGQIVGGPALGVVATIRGVRAALVAVGGVLLPALPLYAGLIRHEGRIAVAVTDAAGGGG